MKIKDPYPNTSKCHVCGLPFFWHDPQQQRIEFCLGAIMNDRKIASHKQWLQAHPGTLRRAWQKIDAMYNQEWTCPTCGHVYFGQYDRLKYKPSDVPEPEIIKELEKEGC